jgi:hypothetical protein
MLSARYGYQIYVKNPFVVSLSKARLVASSSNPFVVSLSNHAFGGCLPLLKNSAKSVVRQAHYERN